MSLNLERNCSVFLIVAVFAAGAWSECIAAEKTHATLPEVVVTGKADNPYKATSSKTGSKTDVPLKDIPAAVVVVPKQLLQDQGATTMNEATRNVSSVTPVMSGGYGFSNRYLIRGLSQRFLRDGMSDGPSMNGYYRTLWDVDNLEVLKGPGSALYGRGEPGGTVNLSTKKPADTFQWELGITAGEFGTVESYIDVGGPLASNMPARFIAGYRHADGFRDLSQSIYGFFPTLSFKPDENQTWTLDYDFRDIEIVPDNYGILFRNGQLIPVDRRNKYYSPFNYSEQEIHRATIDHEWSQNDSFHLRNAFSYDTRDLEFLRNAAGAVNAAGVFASRDARYQTDDAYGIDYQLEGTWKGQTGSWWHTILAGFEYERTDIDTYRSGAALPNITNIYDPVVREDDPTRLNFITAFDRNVSSDTASVYFQDLIELTEQWKLRGGLRYDNVWFTDDGTSRFPVAASPVTYRLLDFEEGLWSWQTGAVYQPAPELSFYAGISEGRFINIQTESSAITRVPEESFQIESGIKTELWNGKVSTNLSVFKTERSNYYVTPFGGGDPVPDGQQETYGVEIDVTGNPYPGLTLYGNASFLEAEFTGDQLSGATNLKGKDPQSVPERQASLWAQYEIQDSPLKGLGFGGGATYQGKSFADALNTNKVPDYWVGDLTVFYRRENDEFRIFIKNFTDEEYFTNATFSGALPGEPLNVSASYKVRY